MATKEVRVEGRRHRVWRQAWRVALAVGIFAGFAGGAADASQVPDLWRQLLSPYALDVLNRAFRDEVQIRRELRFLDLDESTSKRFREFPEDAIRLVAEEYSLSEPAAAVLVELEVLSWEFHLWDGELNRERALRHIERRLNKVVPPSIDDQTSVRLRYSLYRLATSYNWQRKSGVRKRLWDFMAALFVAGRFDEMWQAVGSPSDDPQLLARLLQESPGSPDVLAAVAESTFDQPWQLAIREYLASINGTPAAFRESNLEQRLHRLAELGAHREMVSLWHSLPDAQRRELLEAAVEIAQLPTYDQRNRYWDLDPLWVATSILAALILEGEDGEAREMLRSIPRARQIRVEDLPEGIVRSEMKYFQRFVESVRNGTYRIQRQDREQLLLELLSPTDVDTFEVGLRVLSLRGPGISNGPAALWDLAAARWAGMGGHQTWERFFLRRAIRWMASPANFDARRDRDMAVLLDRGLIPQQILEIRSRIVAGVQEARQRAHERSEQLTQTRSLALLRHQIPRADIATATRFAPYRRRQMTYESDILQPKARRGWFRSEVPAQVPGDPARVVGLARKGKRWAVIQRGIAGDERSSWSAQAYWISLSDDKGMTWRGPWHTGLAAVFPATIVPGSARWRGDDIVLDVVLSKLRTFWSSDFFGYRLRINRREFDRDSDGDGWTDIFERGLLLDPHSADTDGDGLADPIDPLPNIFASSREQQDGVTVALEYVLGRYRIHSQTTGAESRAESTPILVVAPDLPLGPWTSPVTWSRVSDEEAMRHPLAQWSLWIDLLVVNDAGDRAHVRWSGTGSEGFADFVRTDQGWFYSGGSDLGGSPRVGATVQH